MIYKKIGKYESGIEMSIQNLGLAKASLLGMAQAFFRLPLALPSPIGRCAVRTLISRRGLPLKCPQHAHQAVSSAGPAVLSRPTVPFKVPVVAGTQRHLQVSGSFIPACSDPVVEVGLAAWHLASCARRVEASDSSLRHVYWLHLAHVLRDVAAASAQGKVVPFLLADIGEAIAEVELVEW